MKSIKWIASLWCMLLSFHVFSADVKWTHRLEGAAIQSGIITIQDEDVYGTSPVVFQDVSAFGYIQLGLNNRELLDYESTASSGTKEIILKALVDKYDGNGALPIELKVEYNTNDNAEVINIADYRLPGIHKFKVNVQSIEIDGSPLNKNFVYVEAGFKAERYYRLDQQTQPDIKTQMVRFHDDGSLDASCGTNWETCSNTDEVFVNWDYIDGAEAYELEWSWVDNYGGNGVANTRPKSDILFDVHDFKHHHTRIRTSDQYYRIPQVYAKGYLILRVRAVGRWLENTNKENHGAWSSGLAGEERVSDWTHVVTITSEHEKQKNWQYQATYAEEGKKKEVVQYFDGSLRNRQSVTRINSSGKSIVGETVYDAEGRAALEVLPVPQSNSAIKYYTDFNTYQGKAYSHQQFSWEEDESCESQGAPAMDATNGAAKYYSAAAHQNDDNWQRYVPESRGRAFSQIEYTPDNTGRIRRQGGVGETHSIGSGHETQYYYLQPSQKELNRLFGYKVGYMKHYKKNLVVDANGQVSVSYLDPQGKVIATALVGDSPENLDPLDSEKDPTYHNKIATDLLNKVQADGVDTDLDNNELYATGRFGPLNDALYFSKQLGVAVDNTEYEFYYDVETGYYEEECGVSGVKYPYIYDLKLSLKDDCGTELFNALYPEIVGEAQINASISDFQQWTQTLELASGSYTLSKKLEINQQFFEEYKKDYLSANNPCLLGEDYFEAEVIEDCNTTCQECEEELGDLNAYILSAAEIMGLIEDGEPLSEAGLTPTEEQAFVDEQTKVYYEILEDCWSACEAVLPCNMYKQMMLMDMYPGGQYGGTSQNSSLSVYNLSSGLTGYWNDNSLQPNNGPFEYRDSYGAPAIVNAYPDGNGTYDLLDQGFGTVEQVSPRKLNRDAFIEAFQPSWTEALLQFHPEYRLLEYTEEICSLTAPVNTGVGPLNMSSSYFDAYLLEEVNSYDEASGNNLQNVNFLVSLNTIDPYFTNAGYNVQNGLTSLRNSLMQEEISNYKGEGISMLQAAVKTIIYGNNYSSNINLENSWGAITTSYSTEQVNLIWLTYRTYYLSFKSLIDQYFMDYYGVQYGIFNGCLGVNELNSGVLPSFSHHIAYNQLVNNLFASWGVNSSSGFGYPTSLCGSEYDTKEARIVRVDGLYDPALPMDVAIAEGSAEADFEQWQQTGLCPLTVDMERLLHALSTTDRLTSSTTMEDVPEMVPDLFEALTGNAPTIGASMNIEGVANGSELEINIEGGGSECTIVMQAPGNVLEWDTYGGTNGWHIYNIGSSYPIGTGYEVQVVILAGYDFASAQEYVVSYESCLSLNACRSEYEDQFSSLEKDCQKEEQFEQAMLALLQALSVNSELTSGNVDLLTYTEYTNSILVDYFGVTNVIWDGAAGKIVKGNGDGMYFGMSFTSSMLFINSFNIYDGKIYMTIAEPSGQETILSDFDAEYSVFGDMPELDFSCPCSELQQYAESIQEMFNFFVNHHEVSIEDLPNGANEFIANFNQFNYDPSLGIEFIEEEDGFLWTINGLPGLSVTNSSCEFDVDQIAYVTGVTFPFADIYNTTVTVDDSGNPVIISSNDNITSYTATVVLINGTVCTIEGRVVNGYMFNDITPCDDCFPKLNEPLSCNEIYQEYYNTMVGVFNSGFSQEEMDVFNDEFIIPEDDFCSQSLTYIFKAYSDYLNTFDITDFNDPLYLSIAQFGTTGLGYYHDDILPAIQAYKESDFSDPLIEAHLTWNEYIGQEYLPTHPGLCPVIMPKIELPFVLSNYPCNQWENTVNAVNASLQYQIYILQIGEEFEKAYVEGAMQSVKEKFTEKHLDKEYHYTLYYYDRAGNLLQTVPPKGVDRFEYTYSGSGNSITENSIANSLGTVAASNDVIDDYRNNHPSETANLTTQGDVAPSHELETKYRYNSLNQLVWQATPDGGVSRFAYDALGRLVLSQNALQKQLGRFSYSKYDELGRVEEVGELALANFEIDALGRLKEVNGSVSPLVNSAAFPDNLSSNRTEVVKTIYDDLNDVNVSINNGTVSNTVTATIPASDLFGANYGKDHTRNRIVGVIYQDNHSSGYNTFDRATFYDYDVHGNVQHLIQINQEEQLWRYNQHIKHLEYEYDLLSGNVNQVIYQKGEEDQYIHRYAYDSDNRITRVETSKDGVHYEQDAKYFYYDHGPLARTEIGNDKVQATDIAYTLQGWLKTVNGEELDQNTMMGHDGAQASINSQIGRDAFGYSLNYFEDDYAAADQEMLIYSNDYASSQLGNILYNGNIRSMYTALSDLQQDDIGTHQTRYLYDQLNRIKWMEGYNATVSSPGNVNYDPSGYHSTYAFDANGNLTSLTRGVHSEIGNPDMDNFSYNYIPGTNQLDHVRDAISGDNYATDIEHTQAPGNYRYDAIGQLYRDTDEGIDNIKWTVTNKVKQITKGGVTIDFDYDAMGNRVAKHVTQSNDDKVSSYYVLDAQGNPISVHHMEQNPDGIVQEFKLKERNVYGSSRMGMELPNQTMDQVAIASAAQSVDFDNVSVLPDLSNGCGTAGQWSISDIGTSPIYYNHSFQDIDGDGSTDLSIDNTGNYPYLAAQWMVQTIPGETYTVEYNALALNVNYTTVEVRDCSNGDNLYNSPQLTTGTHQFTFTAMSTLSRIKWFAASNGGGTAYSEIALGNVSITGAGDALGQNTSPAVADFYSNIQGDKYFELSNHLGNVLEVVTDRKLPQDEGTDFVQFYYADVQSYSDYYPYGMLMPERNESGSDYKYGFNGMEGDDEVKGKGNSYDFGARMYDGRVGRWLSRDPLAERQPDQSPYKSFYNSPLIFVDPDGNTEYLTIIIHYKESGKRIKIQVPYEKFHTDRVITDGTGSPNANSNNYYSFESIVTITIDKEGKRTTTSSYKILYDHNLKDFDFAFGSVNVKHKGYIKSRSDGNLWFQGDDKYVGEGGRQRAGFSLVTEGDAGSPVKQKAKDSEDVNIDGLSAIGGFNGGNLDFINEIVDYVDKNTKVILSITTYVSYVTDKQKLGLAPKDSYGLRRDKEVIHDLNKKELYQKYSGFEFSHYADDGTPVYELFRVKENDLKYTDEDLDELRNKK